MKKTLITLIGLAAVISAQPVLGQTLVFSENFDALSNGTNATTSNTALTYARIGTGGGLIQSLSPGNFGTGASAVVTMASNSTSLNGIGVQSTLPASTVYTLSLNIRPTNLSGDFVLGLGNGTSFTGASTFAGAHGLFWLQSDNGNFQRRFSTSWTNIGGNTTLAINTNYALHVIANGSGSAVTYSGGNVAAGKMDIYLNGALLDDDVAVTTSGLSATGFRMYQVSQGNFEVDNIQIWNGAVATEAVPEPSTWALIGIGSAFLLWRIRRKNSAV